MTSDEIALALNVTDRGWNDLLFRPLMHDQVAPFGFLLLEKISVTIAGEGEAAFRFFPYLSSLVSLILFWRVSERYLGYPSMLAALIAFALSPTLVFYAGAVKQYSSDIAVTLLLLWMALRYLEGLKKPARATLFGIVGGLSVLISQPAVLVAAGLGVLLIGIAWRRGSPAQPLAMCGGWFMGAAILTYTSVRSLSPATSEYMDLVWKKAFVPWPWEGLAELFWIPARLAESIVFFAAQISDPRSLFAVALVGAYGLLFLAGIPHLVKKDWRAATVLSVPLVVAIAAAAFRVLPLTERVSLFIGPSLLIGCFAGFDGIRAWFPRRLEPLSSAAALGLAALPALFLLVNKPPPRDTSGTRWVLEGVRDRWLPGDRLVMARDKWARVTVEYYGRRRLGLSQWTEIAGSAEGRTTEQYLRGFLRQIDAFRGAPRAWFYLDGTLPCEDEAILEYLDAIGTRLYFVQFEINAFTRVSAHLYDLADPARLGGATAETFPVPDCRA